MNETTFLNDIKTIVSAYVQNYTIDIISRKYETASTMDVTIAVMFQDKSIDENIIKDLLNYQVQNDRYKINFETKKDLGNLDFEVILINAEIYYL